MTLQADSALADVVARYLARLPLADRRRLAEETLSEKEIKALARRAVAGRGQKEEVK